MSEAPRWKVPFDSLALAAVVAELQAFVGGKIQRVNQPDEHTVGLGFFHQGQEGYLLLSCHPQFARAHLAQRRLPNSPTPPGLCQALRARADGGRVAFVRQVGFDRILHVGIEHELGPHTLVVELMGKHSNLMLVDAEAKLLAAAKWVGKTKSSRTILPGQRYEPPPFEPRPSLLEASEGDDLRTFEGASPFLLRLMEAMGSGALAEVQRRIRESDYEAWLSLGSGAYPLSLAPLGLEQHARPSFSSAVESHFSLAVVQNEVAQEKASLAGQIKRVLLARETALADLRQAEAAGGKAATWQQLAELILAYGPSAPPGAAEITVWDYEGNERSVALDPELDYRANAQKLFDRAKRAKGRMGLVRDQIARLSTDHTDLAALLDRVQAAERLDDIRSLKDEAEKRRWLTQRPVPTSRKEDRPHQGHRIRELVGPGGWTVLYGENAESNDYLTLRVAKPNDWWLHVRGGISAHVVVASRNQPDRVPRETLEFAAKIAVQNSPAKHSKFVPVDFTLKKYVRKPKGAPAGTALYTHEKTLHVEG